MSTPFQIGSQQHQLLGEAVRRVEDFEQQIKHLEALKMQELALIQQLAEVESESNTNDSSHASMCHRTVEAEVGFALRLSDRAAALKIQSAVSVVENYPNVHASLSAGRVAPVHAMAIADAGTIIIDSRARRAYEAEALEYAERETPNRTRRTAKILAEKYAVRSFEERCDQARNERCVKITNLDDGMAQLTAILDATAAHAIYDRLSQQARLVQQSEQNGIDSLTGSTGSRHEKARPLDHIRADLVSDLLLSGEPSNELGEVDLSGIQARVQVTIPTLSLLPPASTGMDAAASETTGTDTGAADPIKATAAPTSSRTRRLAGFEGAAALAGYGPIDAATARLLASLQPGWDRISCHPVTGEVIRVDRYRPSAEIRRFIIARDQHCRYPGCSVIPHRADQDHTVDAAFGGETSTRNLAVACRRHHVMKHHTGISVKQTSGGVMEWISVLGKKFKDVPISTVRFKPVQDAADEERGHPPPRSALERLREQSKGSNPSTRPF
ncbi:MAG: DUF222 domain-containing protein [Leucobacter sp.]